MTKLVEMIYYKPELLVNMSTDLVEKAKTEVEGIIAKYDKVAKIRLNEWEQDFKENSNGNEWYWSPKFEVYNNTILAKGVWDQILVCINAKLSGKWN